LFSFLVFEKNEESLQKLKSKTKIYVLRFSDILQATIILFFEKQFFLNLF